MAQQLQPSDLPDFLHNSPYLPLYDAEADFHVTRSTVQRKPSIKQVLRSKPIRTALAFIIILTFYFFRPRQLRNIDFLRPIYGPSCLSTAPVTPPPASYLDQDIDWTRYAYVQYVTGPEYLCNSVMIFEALHRLGSKADRMMLYPKKFHVNATSDSVESRLLLKARDEYEVKLVPIEVQHKTNVVRIWAESYTKLLAFNQTQYDRLLLLDSDSTILQHMDELFFIPPSHAAMPRAYWLDGPKLTSHIMLIQPSARQFERVEKAIKKAHFGVYDMEIVNDLYWRDCVVLPHRRYALLTGEFRSKDHAAYMGNDYQAWDPENAMKEAKFVHFSDYPFPKPWLHPSQAELDAALPYCSIGHAGSTDCRARNIWLGLYKDFRERMSTVCGIGNS